MPHLVSSVICMSMVPWAFSNHYILLDNYSDQRDEELPTLLHFAAKYGLKNLTALLLTCPGALQAYSVANKHGHYPNTIAEKHGFRDLRQFIDEYVVRSRRGRGAAWGWKCTMWSPGLPLHQRSGWTSSLAGPHVPLLAGPAYAG